MNTCRGDSSDVARPSGFELWSPARHAGPELGPECPAVSSGGSECAHRRLEHLYEISQLLTHFESAEETVPAVIALTTETLPLSGAILILEGESRPRTFVWKVAGETADRLAAARVRARAAYAYLVGSRVDPEDDEVRTHLLPETASRPQTEREAARRCIVLPLAVAQRPIFGALQLESASSLVESDLVFVNAMVNQLAIALDRHAAIQARLAAIEVRRVAAEDRRAAAEERRVTAELATRWRDDLLAIVSHELRDPLGVIRMNASLLLRSLGQEAPEQSRRRVNAVQRSAERMTHLVEDLVATASIEAGSLSIERIPTAIAGLVASAIETLQPLGASKALRIESALAPDLPRVFADADRILQVLGNLLRNAIKFTPEGGAITVKGEPVGDTVRLAVSDTGPGISAEEVGRLFDRFWQARRTAAQGAGLGLFIVKGIVEAHGGRVWVETKVGMGSTFFFTLPRA
jgi:signal transduction histidine kinase